MTYARQVDLLNNATGVADRPAPHNGTPTSRAAAASQDTPKRLRAIDRVLNFLAGAGDDGATREEIANRIGMKESTVCGRVAELIGAKPPLAKETDDQRPTTAGKMAAVVVITPAGRQALSNHLTTIGGP